jgi:hypothetical protein
MIRHENSSGYTYTGITDLLNDVSVVLATIIKLKSLHKNDN